MDDTSFRKILLFFDLSWQGYRKVRKGVEKRLARHMHELGCRNVEEYLVAIQRNPNDMQRTRESLTVSISRFFRDRRLWEVIGGSILPRYSSSIQSHLRAWCAGCACGEEVYTLKILWSEVQKRLPALPPLEILATDMNPVVLEKAQIGIYPPSSLKELSPFHLSEYFAPVRKQFAIREDLKDGIEWVLHDFVSGEPPGFPFDLAFFRNNLFTYYRPEVSSPVLVKISNALREGGYLIVGNNEEIPEADVPLKRSPEYRSIYFKASS